MYQGGLFGLAGMMPPRYTQALMTGQGVGGIFACLADIGSKLGKATTFRKRLLNSSDSIQGYCRSLNSLKRA